MFAKGDWITFVSDENETLEAEVVWFTDDEIEVDFTPTAMFHSYKNYKLGDIEIIE